MPGRLVVILGAGASADSASARVAGRELNWRPPLVTELFAERFVNTLNQYPVAQAAAADIRRVEQSSLSIEQFLRETYADRQEALPRRKFLSIPLYLQQVLLQVSYQYTPQPDNYDLLLSRLFDLLENTDLNVVFVTLNYDLLLDRRLNHLFGRLDTLEAYIAPDRRWSLIKLHGSVDWGRPVLSARRDGDLFDPPVDLRTSDQIVLARGPLNHRRAPELKSLRETHSENGEIINLYPAHAVPLGEDDEAVCPPEHFGFLKNELQAADALHLLVIGYSGVDQELLTLLGQTGALIKSFGIVNRDLATGQQVLARLSTGIVRELGDGWIYQGSFGDFVQGDGWNEYLGHLTRNL